jgi:hypothetical protein
MTDFLQMFVTTLLYHFPSISATFHITYKQTVMKRDIRMKRFRSF